MGKSKGEMQKSSRNLINHTGGPAARNGLDIGYWQHVRLYAPAGGWTLGGILQRASRSFSPTTRPHVMTHTSLRPQKEVRFADW